MIYAIWVSGRSDCKVLRWEGKRAGCLHLQTLTTVSKSGKEVRILPGLCLPYDCLSPEPLANRTSRRRQRLFQSLRVLCRLPTPPPLLPTALKQELDLLRQFDTKDVALSTKQEKQGQDKREVVTAIAACNDKLSVRQTEAEVILLRGMCSLIVASPSGVLLVHWRLFWSTYLCRALEL